MEVKLKKGPVSFRYIAYIAFVEEYEWENNSRSAVLSVIQ